MIDTAATLGKIEIDYNVLVCHYTLCSALHGPFIGLAISNLYGKNRVHSQLKQRPASSLVSKPRLILPSRDDQ